MSANTAGPTPRLLHYLAVPLLYFAGVKVGMLTVMPEGMALLWPPNSIFLTALLWFRGRHRWGFAALVVATEIVADVPTFTVLEALLFGLINAGEALLAYFLLSRWQFRPQFLALSDLVKFVVAGPLVAAFASAWLGALVYVFSRGTESSYLQLLRIWWFGDALGLLILTPLWLNVVVEQDWASRPTAPVGRKDLFVGLAALAAFGLLGSAQDGSVLDMLLSPVILLPFLLYVAARFVPIAAQAATALVALLILALTIQGRNPFGAATPQEAVIYAQEFLFIASLTTLGLAALRLQIRTNQRALELVNERLLTRTKALEESNRALEHAQAEVAALNSSLEERVHSRTRELEQALAQVKRLQGLLPLCAWCKKIRDDHDHWHAIEDYIADRTEAQFSHGVCPDCQTRLMKEFFEAKKRSLP